MAECHGKALTRPLQRWKIAFSAFENSTAERFEHHALTVGAAPTSGALHRRGLAVWRVARRRFYEIVITKTEPIRSVADPQRTLARPLLFLPYRNRNRAMGDVQ